MPENAARPPQPSRPLHGGLGWLLIDMVLVTLMTSLVKAGSASYPALQMVFVRALLGLTFILPLIWTHRAALRRPKKPLRNLMRISCNAIALSMNFVALGLLPLAVVNAVGFTRPLVTMVLAVALLGESVSRLRWAGAAGAFCGVLVMLAPGGIAWTPSLLAVFASVLFGALATIQTRMLRDENTVVMMVFYTAGLTVFTAIPAAFVWTPVRDADWPWLITIGLLAQAGQYCWLKAYQNADASLLAPVGYLSVVFATAAGYVFFGETPQPRALLGVAIILAALQGAAFIERRWRR